MDKPDVRHPPEPQLPQASQQRSFETSPTQAELRPSALESHLAREILDWQERSPKPLRVLGEPLSL